MKKVKEIKEELETYKRIKEKYSANSVEFILASGAITALKFVLESEEK